MIRDSVFMDALIRGLMQPEAYDHPVGEFQVLETHLSWVILTGQYAYKIKKPIDLGFANFTTLELRHHFCEEEVRLNRRLAPELYLGVVPIYGTRDRPRLNVTGELIEYCVQMRQFDQHQLLPAVLQRGDVRPEQIDDLARSVAQFHRHISVATVGDRFGTPGSIREAAIDNLDALAQFAANQPIVAELRDWTEHEFARLTDWFHQRHAHGRVRECHGDMHLGNMVLLDDVIRVFDCLEFNADLRWTDLMAEIAFLVMDLQERGRRDFAFRLLNQWLETTGDFDGLTGWRWYLVYRALVRAKVAALRLQQDDLTSEETSAKQDELRTYLALAQSWTQPRPAAVIVTHGLSGSGKSYVAARIAEEFPVIRIRSDVERKRLFGLWGDPPEQILTGDLYAAAVTDQVYRKELATRIPQVIAAGFSVVIDATCLQQWQRQLFCNQATTLGSPFVILDIHAPAETLRQRLTERGHRSRDPSDADIGVLELQLKTQEPLTTEEQPHTISVDTEDGSWWSGLAAELRPLLEPAKSPEF